MTETKKSMQIEKTYEALFALEDLREIFRQSLPTGLDDLQQEEFSDTIAKIKSIIVDLEKGESSRPSCLRVGNLETRTREEEFINIHPIQAAGRLTPEARNRGIIGEFAGATRAWKLNTFGQSWDQIKYASESFLDIAEKYGLSIN